MYDDDDDERIKGESVCVIYLTQYV
jgi:hypothetical protein